MRRLITCLLAACCLAALAAPGPVGAAPSAADTAPALPAAYQHHHSAIYNDPAHWLCLPGRTTDPCGVNLDATVVNADGTTSIEKHTAAAHPAVDCFYVYPTISGDATVNSDLVPGPQEAGVVQQQAARLNSTCRIYAPVYRQRTLAGLFGTARPNPPGRPETAGYTDVVDAFEQYIANYSHGRGFILIGHSQGAGILSRLIASDIDSVPALRNRLVSAIIVGSSVTVPSKTAVVGGTFKHVPLCRKSGQIGCVITFASFRSTAPPPSNSFFGRPNGQGIAGCANPAALGGSAAELSPYFSTKSIHALTSAAASAQIHTRWVKLPNFLKGQCVVKGGFSYLRITVQGNPADPRVDDIPGDLTPMWGLHLVDMNMTQGNLEAEVAAEAATYLG